MIRSGTKKHDFYTCIQLSTKCPPPLKGKKGMKNIEIYETVRGIGKFRFFQNVSALWMLKTKYIQILILVGIFALVYSELIEGNEKSYIKILALIMIGVCLSIMGSRIGAWYSYVDGYEQGFTDATTRDLGYWNGINRNEITDIRKLSEVLEDIEQSELAMTNIHQKERQLIYFEGLKKMRSF